MDKLEIAKALLTSQDPSFSKGGQTMTAYGIAMSDSADGLVMVNFGGDTVSPDDDQSIEVETTFSVREGDEVIVSLIGADGTGKTPIVIGVIGRGDEQQTEIDTASANAETAIELATEANGAASVGKITPQHFFYNSQGAFVTSDEVTCDTFNGDGVVTNFTLSGTPYNSSLLALYVAGASVISGYSVSGSVLTFDSAPTGSIVALWSATEMQDYAKMDSDSFDIVKATKTVASFGEDVTIGDETDNNIFVDSETFLVKRGDIGQELKIGAADSGSTETAFYTFYNEDGFSVPLTHKFPSSTVAIRQVAFSQTQDLTSWEITDDWAYNSTSNILTINSLPRSGITYITLQISFTRKIVNPYFAFRTSGGTVHTPGKFSFEQGRDLVASGDYSAAMGFGSKAYGMGAVAQGRYSSARGQYSYAQGRYAKAGADFQHVFGTNNIEDTAGIYIAIIGNGTAETTSGRSNAYNLDWSGNAEFKGEVYVGGCTPNGETPYPVVRYNTAQGQSEYWDGSAWVSVGGGASKEILTATILAADWTGSGPYTNSVTVSGLLATDTPVMDLVASSTYATAQNEISEYGNIYKAVCANNTLTVYATSAPTHDLNIQLLCVR